MAVSAGRVRAQYSEVRMRSKKQEQTEGNWYSGIE
jgi:hypothetical protein